MSKNKLNKKLIKDLSQKVVKPKKSDKVNLAAQQTAIEFLTSIHDEYDQDTTPRFAQCDSKLKFLDKAEQIPIVSDTNVNQLKDLLVKFYNRNVTLELK